MKKLMTMAAASLIGLSGVNASTAIIAQNMAEAANQ
ncbi:hypothetical protein J2T37_001061 [Neisseria perflava]|nr:hypothetical protein [Neisseria perflava]MCP1772745.1 hypothetical protein [Neisseria perflava]